MLQIPGLYVAKSEGRGRGVFTLRDISVDDFIEICPVIVVPPDQIQYLDQTIFHDYYFLWPQPKGSACLPLGYGVLYNHSHQPNAKIIMDLDKNEFEFRCIVPIQAGEEIFIDYTDGEGENSKRLWFEVIS